MTLCIRTNTEIPEDTATLGRKLLKENNRYRVIGDHLPEIVCDEDFADIYAPTGRNAVSPGLLSMVTIFQFLEDVPDREAAEMVVIRVDWKYALHLPLDYAGFHEKGTGCPDLWSGRNVNLLQAALRSSAAKRSRAA